MLIYTYAIAWRPKYSSLIREDERTISFNLSIQLMPAGGIRWVSHTVLALLNVTEMQHLEWMSLGDAGWPRVCEICHASNRFMEGRQIMNASSEKYTVRPQNDPVQSQYICKGIHSGRPSYSQPSDALATKNLCKFWIPCGSRMFDETSKYFLTFVCGFDYL